MELPRPKLAHHLPAPRSVTAEEMAEATREARAFREALDRASEGMERLTAEDLAIVLR